MFAINIPEQTRHASPTAIIEDASSGASPDDEWTMT
jgi:hypothetical protein